MQDIALFINIKHLIKTYSLALITLVRLHGHREWPRRNLYT